MKVSGQRTRKNQRLLQKVLLAIFVITVVLFVLHMSISPSNREIQHCRHTNSHQIILMRSIIMLKAFVHVGYEAALPKGSVSCLKIGE
jgi:magnesium-transporting ATPase (P-type)